MTDRTRLTRRTGTVVGERWPGVRLIRATDGRRIGRLLHNAYRGTVDDEGETLGQAIEEASQTLEGKYGTLIKECSFVMEDEGELSSVCLVTDYFEDMPLMAFCATRKEVQRQGIASHLIKLSLQALKRRGYDKVRLVVTKANAPAMALYLKLGFVEEQP